MKPTFFRTPSEFRKWLERNHDTTPELLVGFYKRGSGKPSITWPESVDEALCFGWIDGVRRSVDEDSYTIRFTPRRPRSYWSAVNLQRIKELTKTGRMHPAGIKVYEARDPKRVYSHQQGEKDQQLAPAYAAKLRANKKAWTFFQSQAPWYQRTVSRWVMSAKKEETRLRRLAALIHDSAQGQRIGLLKAPTK